MRRSFFVMFPLSLCACGLILDFNGFDANFDKQAMPPDETDDGGGSKKDGGKDASGDASRAPCAVPEGAIGCELGEISALAATDQAVLWLAPRGAVLHSLSGTPSNGTQSLVTPGPANAGGGAAVAFDGKLSWGFRTTDPSQIMTCDGQSCAPAPIGEPIAQLTRLAASKAGLYALSGEETRTTLQSVGATVAPLNVVAGTSVTDGDSNPITHFAVSDKRAFWRVDQRDNGKHECQLDSCATTIQTKSSGDAPFVVLSTDDKGFASVHRDEDVAGVTYTPRVKLCLVLGEQCQKGAVLPLDVSNFKDDDTRIFLVPAAVAISANDLLYVGGLDDGATKKLTVGFAPTVEGSGAKFTALAQPPGNKVVAVAVNGENLFYAVTVPVEGGRVQSIIYMGPRN